MKFLILTVLGLLTVVSAFPAAFAAHSTPFNGNGTGTFTDTSPTTVLIAGTGHYDHLGLTTLRFPSTITGQAACGGFTATEQDNYTGANGDSVYLTVHDTICPTSSPGAFQLSGSFTVTGGTGRFVDASGSGTFAGKQTGTITY
jgi:hypothetical protein